MAVLPYLLLDSDENYRSDENNVLYLNAKENYMKKEFNSILLDGKYQ